MWEERRRGTIDVPPLLSILYLKQFVLFVILA